jgi:hypothetical protein
MKKFFIALALLSAGLLTTQGLSAQKRVIKVQGHPHELLTEKHGGKEDATTIRVVTGSSADVNLADIQCWTGGLDPNIAEIDSAVLLVKWTDQSALDRGDSILAWGYHWNSISIYVDPATGKHDTTQVHKYTIDMIRAVANADCRFSALLQNTSVGNFVAGGFGYNFEDGANSRVPIAFNKNGAIADTRIKFRYTNQPNCAVGQGAFPYSVTQQVEDAVLKSSNNSTMTGTGIIDHPFNADYGYPAYDYDYWVLKFPGPDDEWQSGWYNGYWAFYHKEQLDGGFTADTLSITTRVLGNHCVDGFVFENHPEIWPPLHDMSGSYTGRTCNCGCNASATETGKRK